MNGIPLIEGLWPNCFWSRERERESFVYVLELAGSPSLSLPVLALSLSLWAVWHAYNQLVLILGFRVFDKHNYGVYNVHTSENISA